MTHIVKRVCMLLAVLTLTACASTSTFEAHYTKANEGDAFSQLVIGDEYFFGSNETPKNKELAIKYYKLSSEGGNSDASFNLARLYQKDKEFDKAIYYYEKSSEAGNVKAQDNLAIMYQNGEGVAKDLDKAEALYLQALSNGSIYAHRNLGVLYRDNNQPNKAIEMFQAASFSPTKKTNTYSFKKNIALELMDLHLEVKDDENAYVWGSTAVLSGLFDANIADADAKIKRYQDLANKLADDRKNHLAKRILENHYNVFVKYESAIIYREKFKVTDGLIVLPTTGDSIAFSVYNAQIQIKTLQKINFYEGKEDKKSRINLAISKLQMAAYNVSVGAVHIHYHVAVQQIKEAIAILNAYDDSKLSNMKETSQLKLNVAEQVAKAQKKLKEEHSAKQ